MSDYSLVPADHKPDFGEFSLVPVEHNPFSEGDPNQRAGSQPATQPQPPAALANLPDVGAPAIADGGPFTPGMAIGNRMADVAGKVAFGLMKQFATLPQRAIDASAQDVQHLGEQGYMPRSIGPAFETAMTMAGAGLPMAEAGAAGAVGGKLPLPDSVASVARKLDTYLLDPAHVTGGPKANWFEQALGFTRDNAADLAKQLVFDESQAVRTGANEYGTLFNQTIDVTGVNGRTIPVTTGWIIRSDGVPRLVTAFPGR
jgi:hypothetical protein